MFKPEKILVPTDFSENDDHGSTLAIKQAAEIATQFGSELILLHVISEEAAKMPLFFLDQSKLADLNRRMLEHWQYELKTIREKYIPDSVKCSTKIRHGVAYNEILKEERESAIDLIVISSRGQSLLHEFFYGHTTEKVVRRATCSVLVARKKENGH